MPQIKVFLNPLALNMITAEKFPELSVQLMEAVESSFGIIGKNDVAVDFFGVLFTKNEASVQSALFKTDCRRLSTNKLLPTN